MVIKKITKSKSHNIKSKPAKTKTSISTKTAVAKKITAVSLSLKKKTKTRARTATKSEKIKPLTQSSRHKEKGAIWQEVRKYRHQFEMIRKTSLKLTSVLSLDEMLGSLVETAQKFFSADAVSCMLWDEKN